jgi:hypothetical protein
MRLFFPLTCLLFCLPAGADQSPKFGEVTDDPQRFVLSHSEFPEEGLTQFDCHSCSTMKDLLFIAATQECGNAGCGYFIFKKSDVSAYSYVANVFLSPGGFQFLSSSHNGFADIRFYHHMSAFEGTLTSMQFNGANYEAVGAPKTIKSSEFNKYVQPEPVKAVRFSRDLEEVVK